MALKLLTKILSIFIFLTRPFNILYYVARTLFWRRQSSSGVENFITDALPPLLKAWRSPPALTLLACPRTNSLLTLPTECSLCTGLWACLRGSSNILFSVQFEVVWMASASPPHLRRNRRVLHLIAGWRMEWRNRYGAPHSRKSHMTKNSNLLNGRPPFWTICMSNQSAINQERMWIR